MTDDLLQFYLGPRTPDRTPPPVEADAIHTALENLKAPKRNLGPSEVPMMLAEVRDHPFTRPGWIFEVKLDGYRVMAGVEQGKPRLISRNGLELGETFPEITRAIAALPFDNIVIDGEVVALSRDGRPSFQLLQQREAARIFYVFDLPGLLGHDLRGLPLLVRKELLHRVLPHSDPIRYLDHLETEGEALFRQVITMELEGIVAKKADSLYKAGRSPLWNKIRADRSDDFVVVGYSQPKGARGGFGALHLGQFVDGRLVYSGRAGSGFSSKLLKEAKTRMDRIQRPSPPCDGPVPPGEAGSVMPISAVPDYRTATWVAPEIVAEVRFKEWTQEGYLRHPVFMRFRDDKKPAECIRQLASDLGSKPRPRKKSGAATAATKVQVSNLDKVFWPEDGYTKGDLIEYYRTIAPWLLPYLHDRPVVLTRYPDGIRGKNFFQKDAPGYVPEWLRTVRLWSDQAQRDIDYFVCENEDGLVYLANLATIPLHIWASRVGTLAQPDWCSLDLDPKGAPFSHVVELAQAARELCERIGLPCHIKTTGSSGLHVMMALARHFTHEQAKSLGEVLAHALVKQHRAIATTTRALQKREGKVYVDYGQNGHGKLLVAPFSVRPLPGAPVSMPLQWSEVTDQLDIRSFTIRNAKARMTRLKQDPLRPILETEPDLAAVLAALQREM